VTDHQSSPDQPAAPPARSQRGIWLAGYAILLGSLLLVWRYNALDHDTELVDLWKISEGETPGMVVYTVAITLLTGGWLWAIREARGLDLRDAWLPVGGITLLVCVAFVFVYPATAIDVYIYAARSHLLTEYGLNPSTVSPDRLWELDPYVRYASQEWSDDTSPYGPLWNVLAAPMTAMDDDTIGNAVLLFKTLMTIAMVGTGALIHSIARRVQPDDALAATLAWLWCPLVLWEGIANSHNDMLLVLLVIAALWSWTFRREGWVVPLLGAAALLKVVTVMLLPAAVIAIIVRTGWNRRLLVVALQTAALSAGAIWIAFVPFFDFSGTVDAIRSQRGVWVTSPALLADLVLDQELHVDVDFGLMYERFSTGVILLLAFGGALLAWRRPALLPRIGYEQLFWFLLLATSNMRPWYVIWLVALAVALPLGWPLVRAIAWGTGALFAYIYTAWIQNWTEPTFLDRTAINLAITLVPVLVVTVWEGVRLVRRAEPRAGTQSEPVPEGQVPRWPC
jgi:hypothetical protein